MSKVEARTFTTADWPEWLDFELHERDEGHSEQSYLPYLRSRQALYQAMIADGLGDWWGIWQEGQLVASCGLFFCGTLGRFQLVRTHHAWRNQGSCPAHLPLSGVCPGSPHRQPLPLAPRSTIKRYMLATSHKKNGRLMPPALIDADDLLLWRLQLVGERLLHLIRRRR